jgi:hypothetical protein
MATSAATKGQISGTILPSGHRLTALAAKRLDDGPVGVVEDELPRLLTRSDRWGEGAEDDRSGDQGELSHPAESDATSAAGAHGW